MNFIDFAPVKNCKSPLETYGEICIKCNKCGRFNEKCILCNKDIKRREERAYVELYDVFSAPVCLNCLEGKDFGKLDQTYNKYFVYMTKREFLKKYGK